MNYKDSIKVLSEAIENLEVWLNSHPFNDFGAGEINSHQIKIVIDELSEKLKGNYPFQSGVYAGQMLKPPHPVAWIAQSLTSLINPNNHALDGGPPTSEMEKEVIPQFAQMFGYREPFLGHLTSSGTIANLEALWVSKCTHPQKGVAFSSQAHYTHRRMCEVLGIEAFEIPVDTSGKWDLDKLRKYADRIGTVVVTLGTTGLGRVEPLHEILPVCKELGIRIHADAAYGGYFKLLTDVNAASSDGSDSNPAIDPTPWQLTAKTDSIVIDPHKHGLQPYGCGCVLFKNPEVGKFYKHDSPYTYFSSEELHLGEISLECSRAGAAAASLWATLKLFPLRNNSPMVRVLGDCRSAALSFHDFIRKSMTFNLMETPELDIVCYYPAADTTSEISRLSKQIFSKGMQEKRLFLSLFKVSADFVISKNPDVKADTKEVTILRSVFMKPVHKNAAHHIFEELTALLDQVRNS